LLIYKKWPGWNYDSFTGEEYLNIGSEIVMQYNILNRTSSQFNKNLDFIYKVKCKYNDCIKEFVDHPGLPFGCREAWISPNSDKFACVAQHYYGPEDIIIFANK
jgi:hypothetical protein